MVLVWWQAGGGGGAGDSVQADCHTGCSHVSSLGGSSGQTGPGWVTAHAGGAEQTQHRPGQPHITPLVGSSLGTSNRVTLSNTKLSITRSNTLSNTK